MIQSYQDEHGKHKKVGSILVLCTQNAVRSPILEGLMRLAFGTSVFIRSAGVEASELSPLAADVMDEIGIDISAHHSVAYDDIDPDSYDLVIALSRPAYELAQKIGEEQAVDIEYWSVGEPPALGESKREQMCDAMRRIRDDLKLHLENRFLLDLPYPGK